RRMETMKANYCSETNIGPAARLVLRSAMGAAERKADMSAVSNGIVSGSRCIGAAELDDRVRRAAAGFTALGVTPGQCAALLMRNDIAFIEAAYAAQTLGAYAVPINWHFKAEEIAYILADCGARVLVAHADLLAPIAVGLPADIVAIAVSTPPEVTSAYGI